MSYACQNVQVHNRQTELGAEFLKSIAGSRDSSLFIQNLLLEENSRLYWKNTWACSQSVWSFLPKYIRSRVLSVMMNRCGGSVPLSSVSPTVHLCCCQFI